ncbi:MAG: hypothetical protein ABW352_04840 [Polyangiales bacterium]
MITRMLLATALLALLACGDEEPAEPPEAPGTDAGGRPADGSSHLGGDAAVPAPGKGSDASAPTAGKSCTNVPPHVRGFEGNKVCNYLCEKGYADCDGELSNGCEVDLKAPDACSACPAMACLQPELCGPALPVCQSHGGLRWTYDAPSSATFGSVAGGKTPEQVFATIGSSFDGEVDTGLELSSGALFQASVGEDSRFVWSADADEGGSALPMQRVGDRLYLLGSSTNSGALVLVTDLDGKQLWTQSVSAPGASLCASKLAVGELGEVYVAAVVCKGELDLGGKHYDSDLYGTETMIIAFDARGVEQWRSIPHDEDSGDCWLGANSDIRSLKVIGGKLLELNRECVMEVDRTSGKAGAQHKLYEFAQQGKLLGDSAGNVYVAGQTDTETALPSPDAFTLTEDVDNYVMTTRVFVSKYDGSFKHLWTRPVANRRKVGWVDADITPSGRGQLIGYVTEAGEYPLQDGPSRYFAFDWDADGKVLGTGLLSEGWKPRAISFGDDGTPWLGGTFSGDPMLGSGQFLWEYGLAP